MKSLKDVLFIWPATIGRSIMPSKTTKYNQLWQAYRDAYPLKGHAWVDEEAGRAWKVVKKDHAAFANKLAALEQKQRSK